MGRSPGPCFSKHDAGLHRGAWTAEEDKILSEYIKTHGLGPWNSIAKKAGLKRRGKSCRMRWLNYLREDIKRGNISLEEEELLIRLHRLLGNRWIAGRLPGRTDNDIKNYWNTHLSKRLEISGSEANFQKPFERSDVPSYSYNNEKEVEDKNNNISQNTSLKTRADRSCGRAIVDVGNHILDTNHAINPEGEVKAPDDNLAEVDMVSKSWCQLLLENNYYELEVINDFQANSIINNSFKADHYDLHHIPYPPLNSSMFLHEKHSSLSCNLDNHEFPQHLEYVHSTNLQTSLDLSWL